MKKSIDFWKYAILILFSITCIYPMVWMFLSSLKTNENLLNDPWGLAIPIHPENYVRALIEGHLGRYFFNSVYIAVMSVAISTILGAMVSYAISRMYWKLSKLVLDLFLLGMMIPIYATIIPLFSMFNKLNLLNTSISVILVHVVFGLPMIVFILTGFMESLPREMEEAAVIDGASIYTIFARVMLPVTKPSLVTVAVITFIDVWNDLLVPQIFLTSSEKMTLPVGLMEFKGLRSTDYVTMIAAIVITVIPTVIVYSILHKSIIEGMVTGAVKG